MDAILQFLIDWGYWGYFSALLLPAVFFLSVRKLYWQLVSVRWDWTR